MPDRADLTCRELIELLGDYLDGALSAGRRHGFDRHLAGCEPCRNYLESYESTIALTRSLRGHPE